MAKFSRIKSKISLLLPAILLIFSVGAFGQELTQTQVHRNRTKDRRMLLQGKVGICPVDEGVAYDTYEYTYRDEPFYFCCRQCMEAFKNDPQKYLSKIEEIDVEMSASGFVPAAITVANGDIVRLYATSSDEESGLFIRDYGVNVDLPEGRTRLVEFIADKKGEFDITCSPSHCGKNHATLKAKLIVQ